MLSCLLVDDSPRFLAAARAILQQQGLRVLGVASTGAEAQQAVRRLHPDVVLLDVDLGGESGFEVAGRLAGTTTVILMSVRGPEGYAELVATAPVAGFLAKSALSADAVYRLSYRGRR